MKARVRVVGRLAFVETEGGGRAVVPASELCEFLRRFKLEVEGLEARCAGGGGGVEERIRVVEEAEEEP